MQLSIFNKAHAMLEMKVDPPHPLTMFSLVVILVINSSHTLLFAISLACQCLLLGVFVVRVLSASVNKCESVLNLCTPLLRAC